MQQLFIQQFLPCDEKSSQIFHVGKISWQNLPYLKGGGDPFGEKKFFVMVFPI